MTRGEETRHTDFIENTQAHTHTHKHKIKHTPNPNTLTTGSMAMQPGEEVARGSLAAGRSRYERDSMGRRWISTGLDSHSNRKRCISISSCCHSSEHSLTWFQHRAKGEMVSGRGDHGRRTQLNVSLNMFVTRSEFNTFTNEPLFNGPDPSRSTPAPWEQTGSGALGTGPLSLSALDVGSSL